MFKGDDHLYVRHCIPTSLLGCLIGISTWTCPQTSSEFSQSAFPISMIIVQAENWKIIYNSSFLFLIFHIQILWLNKHIKNRLSHHFSPFIISYINQAPSLSDIIACLGCCDGSLMTCLLPHVASEATSFTSLKKFLNIVPNHDNLLLKSLR